MQQQKEETNITRKGSEATKSKKAGKAKGPVPVVEYKQDLSFSSPYDTHAAGAFEILSDYRKHVCLE